MNLGKEKKAIYYEYRNSEITSEEESFFINYAHKNIPREVLTNLLINWSINDILLKYVNENLKKKSKKK